MIDLKGKKDMNYELKDKISATKEFLSDLEMKSWQEIEHLQTQIANLAEGPVNDRLKQLLKNLLTSYYVFAGGIENLEEDSGKDTYVATKTEQTSEEKPVEIKAEIPDDVLTVDEPGTTEHAFNSTHNDVIDTEEISEPFEYFVDFDEPIGEPLTDKDLYD